MSKFKKAMKKKELASALEKHPLREMKDEIKSDYIKGLVNIVVEGYFSNAEKDNINR